MAELCVPFMTNLQIFDIAQLGFLFLNSQSGAFLDDCIIVSDVSKGHFLFSSS